MKIAVIGKGNVGATLGGRWAHTGHEVVFGVRDPQDDKVIGLLHAIRSNARAATVPAAAASAEVVVLATPWDAAQEAVLNMEDLTGKILVDCTNPLRPDLGGLTIGHTTSAAERIAGWAPGARVVKAFNCTGSGNMAKPAYREGALSMFLCGDDAEAKSTVGRLAADIGFEAVDAGPLASARYLEPLAMLWIHLAYAQRMGPDIGFRLMRR